jgi:hypothetical protein
VEMLGRQALARHLLSDSAGLWFGRGSLAWAWDTNRFEAWFSRGNPAELFGGFPFEKLPSAIRLGF